MVLQRDVPLDGLEQLRFQRSETLVQCGRIRAVLRDHRGPNLTTANDLHRVLLDPLDDRVRHSGGRLAYEAEFRSGIGRRHHWSVSRPWIYRQHMHTLALQFAPHCLAKMRNAGFDAGIGRVERHADQRDAG